MLRAVIDTNVLFEGLTIRGTCGLIVDSWVAQLFSPCVSTSLAYEYQDVLGKKIGDKRRPMLLQALQALLTRAEFVPIYFTYRPSSPDPGDDHVIDCVMNARASLVTLNRKDFEESSRRLGFSLLSPEEFLALL